MKHVLIIFTGEFKTKLSPLGGVFQLDHAIALKKRGIKCKSGTFGAYMELKLNNDGPFTLILNSK